jgi:hypothetical protein
MQGHASGAVVVEVLIDEEGKVIKVTGVVQYNFAAQ